MRAEQMARSCLVWRLQPSEFWALNRLERQAFSDQAEQLAAEMKRGR